MRQAACKGGVYRSHEKHHEVHTKHTMATFNPLYCQRPESAFTVILVLNWIWRYSILWHVFKSLDGHNVVHILNNKTKELLCQWSYVPLQMFILVIWYYPFFSLYNKEPFDMAWKLTYSFLLMILDPLNEMWSMNECVF